MKKMLLFLGLVLGGLTTVTAQITGRFYQQSGYVYFVGQNVSGNFLDGFTVQCVNMPLNQQQTYDIGRLADGETFSIGPSDGWSWQAGEQVIVTLPSGQSFYWVYEPARSHGVPTRKNTEADSTNVRKEPGADGEKAL